MRGLKKRILTITKDISVRLRGIEYRADWSKKMRHDIVVRDDITKCVKFNLAWLKMNPGELMIRELINDIMVLDVGVMKTSESIKNQYKDAVESWRHMCHCGEEIVLYKPPRCAHHCATCGAIVQRMQFVKYTPSVYHRDRCVLAPLCAT